jgi:hypothetical protein
MRNWKKSPFTMMDVGREASRPILEVGFDGDASIYKPASYDYYKIRATYLQKEHLSKKDFATLDTLFFKIYSKSYNLDDYKYFTDQFCLYDQPYYAHRDYREVIDLLDDQLLADLCEDVVPDIGIYAVDRVFGPMGDYGNLQLAGAIMSFAPLLEHNKTPIGQLNAENRRFTRTQRLSMACQAMTPVMLYEIKQHELVPLLPIAHQYQLSFHFQEDLHLRYKGAKKLLCRIYKMESGIFSIGCAMPLVEISTEFMYSVAMREYIRLQRNAKRLFWEDILCYRSEILYLQASMYSYINHYKETKKCWSYYWVVPN